MPRCDRSGLGKLPASRCVGRDDAWALLRRQMRRRGQMERSDGRDTRHYRPSFEHFLTL
ncbi:hypothetical protein D9X30_2652 [Cupriavidus sp. U2]|nr:hypothetical protein D9X30_2652 [Cupriavidus sp. U2]